MEATLKRAFSIKAIKELAQKELPKPIFDYANGGAGDEIAMRLNESSFEKFALMPRPLNGSIKRNLSVEVFGKKIELPLILGPTGLSGLFWPDGEIETAKAAFEAKTGFCLSHGSSCTIEDIGKNRGSPKWMQVFIYKDRGFTRELCERAFAARFDALILTIDNQVPGKRERDLQNGFTIPPKLGFRTYASMLNKYKWLWRMRSRLGKITFENYVRSDTPNDLASLGARMAGLLDPEMTWKDVEWLRRIWKKPLILKGILHIDDAMRCLELGIDGIILSNHGGRQLEGAVSSILVLNSIAKKIDHRIPIFMDGGIRRGTDVIKALALGASACLVGRPQLWGLAIGGHKGVLRMLEIFREEIDISMGLCGLSSISEISEEVLYRLD